MPTGSMPSKRAQLRPDNTTSTFPSVTYNTINVHQKMGSTIQQGGAGAAMATSYSGDDIDKIRELVAVLKTDLANWTWTRIRPD